MGLVAASQTGVSAYDLQVTLINYIQEILKSNQNSNKEYQEISTFLLKRKNKECFMTVFQKAVSQ